MTEVEEIEARVRHLPSEDFARFRDWFHEFENDLWDRQIESDYRAGKLDTLINQARAELAQGKAREI
jgi:hypothetical protein